MRSLSLAFVATIAAACSTTQTGAQGGGADAGLYGPIAGGPRASTLDGRLTAPVGFTVSIFARLKSVRYITLGSDGAVYTSATKSGEVVRLADTNGDGVADQQTVAVAKLNRPHGLAFHGGWLYIANTDGVVRVRLDSLGKAAGSPERVNRYSGGGSHFTRTVVFGADSGMYVAIGSTCNVCEEQSPERAAVMRYATDGRNGRVFAKGLRNAVGLAVHPGTGAIWATQNERDNLRPDHQNLPAEEINILQDHGDYGWPYCHGDRVPNPEFNDNTRCASTIPPALKIQAHSAPLGITFLDRATAFPADYRGDALVALHGSWNRDRPTGAKVVRVHVRDGRPVSYEDFVAGWQTPDGQRWGRPVDVMVYADGSVLITDDASGAIYRVTAAR